MRYISTRGEAPELGFEDALLTGLARDGGLYVPKTWPRLEPETIAAFAGKPFADVAASILDLFAGGAIPRAELLAITRDAYGRFDHPAVTPLVQTGPNAWILELFHGPTLAFKDVAMQVVARLMDRVLATRNTRVTVVGATSGDTGGAAIEAFRGSKRVDAIVLFPNGRVSDVQRRMMTTATEANVHAVAIDGTFDDCQALLKAMFNDLAFATARSWPASTRSTGRAWSRRSPTTSLPQRRSAVRSAPCPSRCQRAISATSSPGTPPGAWACRSNGW